MGAARGTRSDLENMESTDERGLRRNSALLPTFPQYRHGHGAPPLQKGEGFFPDPTPCKGSCLCDTIRAQRERKVSKGMARKTKSTSVPEAPAVPETSPVSGQAAPAPEAAPVPEATREPGESEESRKSEAAEATPESKESKESRESGESKESPEPVSAPKPARPLQPTVKDELDDPFGMVGFLD